jgi:hypothetical protein
MASGSTIAPMASTSSIALGSERGSEEGEDAVVIATPAPASVHSDCSSGVNALKLDVVADASVAPQQQQGPRAAGGAGYQAHSHPSQSMQDGSRNVSRTDTYAQTHQGVAPGHLSRPSNSSAVQDGSTYGSTHQYQQQYPASPAPVRLRRPSNSPSSRPETPLTCISSGTPLYGGISQVGLGGHIK